MTVRRKIVADNHYMFFTCQAFVLRILNTFFFNPSNKLSEVSTMIILIYSWGHWNFLKLNNWPKVSYLLAKKPELKRRPFWPQNLYSEALCEWDGASGCEKEDICLVFCFLLRLVGKAVILCSWRGVCLVEMLVSFCFNCQSKNLSKI